MKIREFTYKKSTGDESKRKVLVLQENALYVEGIDLTHLTSDEEKVVLEAAEMFTEKITPYVAKAYRRFNTSAITNE